MKETGRKNTRALPEHVKLHRKIVRKLNEQPDWWDLEVNSPTRNLMVSLKPYIWEIWKTNQLTKEEIRDAINSTGLRMTENNMKLLLKRLSWRYAQSQGNKPIPKKFPKALDAAILKLSRDMPAHQMDPRIALRYYEIIRAQPPETNSNFLRAADVLNAIERKARHAAGIGKTLEEAFAEDVGQGNNINLAPDDIRDDEEIMRWVRFA